MSPFKTENLQVYDAGELTVVGFGRHDVLDHLNVPKCRDELAELIKDHDIKTLAFDLTGVKLIPSGMLGLLASLPKLGVKVLLCNPSGDIKEILEITRLDQFVDLHEFEIEA